MNTMQERTSARARGQWTADTSLDLVVSGLGTVLYAPFFAACAGAIYLEDGGPVLFRQDRLGRDRVGFSICKWRTMRGGQVTRVGRWLRSTGLDETAQFFNVLRGDMSMVGPRPLTQDDVDRLDWNDRAYDIRFAVRPGITGLAQLFGGKTSRHSFALDRLYIRRRSALLDLYLIGLSFAANLMGKKRVRYGHAIARRQAARLKRTLARRRHEQRR